MNFKEAYQTLGIPEGSSKEDAKKAFRKLAQTLHPDKNKEPDAEARFKLINEAYQVIDTGKPTGDAAREERQRAYQSKQQDISDIFSHIRNHTRQQTIMLEDININISLSFKEAVMSCKKTIKYNRRNRCTGCEGEGEKRLHNGCNNCGGTGTEVRRSGHFTMQQTCAVCRGQIKTEPCTQCKTKGYQEAEISLDVQIPGGVVSGNVLRLGGVGHFGGMIFGQAQYSNVNVVLSIVPEKGLTLEGEDVISQVNVSLLNALTGIKVKVPSVNGEQEITLPKLSKNKQEVILPKLGVNGQGNQRVILNIEYPIDTDSLIEFLKTKEN